MTGRPDSAQQQAAEQLDLRKRMREVQEAILARTPEHDLEPSLDRIAAVMELLGDPQRAFPVIHVTGTNGKTSTTRMIERLLREMGLSTGRFTSPHLHDIRERIALNGEPIPAEKFVAAYDDVLPFIEMVDTRSVAEGGPRMTYFEVVVAVAYAAFADAPVDVAVVEVGMGGSWDATNVVDGQVAVVTPIAIDHERFLGSSVEDIATEKSGIIKPGAVAVIGLQEPEVAEILLERGREVEATLAFEGNDFGILTRDVAVGGQQLSIRGLGGDYDELFLPLHGPHQGHNAAVALAAVEAFVGGGQHRLEPDDRPGRPGRRVLTGAAGDRPPFADRPRRRRAQPGRGAGPPGRDGGLVHLRPGDRRGRGARGQGRRLDARDPRAGAGRGRRHPHHVAARHEPGPAR